MTRTILLLAVCAGCTHGASPPAEPLIPITVQSLQADSIATAITLKAFEADAQLRRPDSVYAPNAEIIANGAPRADAPLVAGVASGGNIQLGSSRFAVTGNFVWGTTQYRWVPSDPAQRIVEGWATLVIARLKDGSWRILHLHSSTVRDSS